MRTITHSTSGPVTLDLGTFGAVVEVYVEDRSQAEVTVMADDPSDDTARQVIERITHRSDGHRFVVRMPQDDAAGGSSVSVHGGGGSSVFVGGAVGGVVVSSGGGVTIVNGRVISGRGVTVINGGGGDIRVVARLPRRSSLDLKTAAGDVTTSGHLESVSFDSSAAGLRADSVGHLEADASSGSVSVDRLTTADVTTSSGSIHIAALAGNAKLRASSGDIAVHAVADCVVKARASSGDVRVTAAPGVTVDTSGCRVSSGRLSLPR